MEFLVHIEVRWPPNGDRDELARLIDAERARAGELAEAGLLKRLWRLPGRFANYGLWSASDATELHEAFSSLPLFRWLDIEVIALAEHPADPARSPD